MDIIVGVSLVMAAKVSVKVFEMSSLDKFLVANNINTLKKSIESNYFLHSRINHAIVFSLFPPTANHTSIFHLRSRHKPFFNHSVPNISPSILFPLQFLTFDHSDLITLIFHTHALYVNVATLSHLWQCLC